MVKGQGQATFSKQKACLYFMSKHTVSVRPPTIAAYPELMNGAGGRPMLPPGAQRSEAKRLYSS